MEIDDLLENSSIKCNNNEESNSDEEEEKENNDILFDYERYSIKKIREEAYKEIELEQKNEEKEKDQYEENIINKD